MSENTNEPEVYDYQTVSYDDFGKAEWTIFGLLGAAFAGFIGWVAWSEHKDEKVRAEEEKIQEAKRQERDNEFRGWKERMQNDGKIILQLRSGTYAAVDATEYNKLIFRSY
jgi:hypothetical protein